MMSPKRTIGLAVRSTAAACALAGASAWATPTSLELFGVLFDGSGNRINSPFVLATSALFATSTGGVPLVQFGKESVQVSNGLFVQVFSVDDSVFAGDAYLQLEINGFTLEPRLGTFYNGSYYFASGTTAGPASETVFRLYAGPDAPPVPEPNASAMLSIGLSVLGWLSLRRRRG